MDDERTIYGKFPRNEKVSLLEIVCVFLLLLGLTTAGGVLGFYLRQIFFTASDGEMPAILSTVTMCPKGQYRTVGGVIDASPEWILFQMCLLNKQVTPAPLVIIDEKDTCPAGYVLTGSAIVVLGEVRVFVHQMCYLDSAFERDEAPMCMGRREIF